MEYKLNEVRDERHTQLHVVNVGLAGVEVLGKETSKVILPAATAALDELKDVGVVDGLSSKEVKHDSNFARGCVHVGLVELNSSRSPQYNRQVVAGQRDGILWQNREENFETKRCCMEGKKGAAENILSSELSGMRGVSKITHETRHRAVLNPATEAGPMQALVVDEFGESCGFQAYTGDLGPNPDGY
ncbi:hypothetical protein B0H14DRAFT_2581609 [Mycena olivaceomarginata]|nr:hypothetical protein B0H14DRAFT_2581609 [Mycena olivaceomarginata]